MQTGPAHGRLIEVTRVLEAWEGWEASNVVAAKAYAAWQIRNALGIDLPDPSDAQMHIDYQRINFADYERTGWCARAGVRGIVRPVNTASAHQPNSRRGRHAPVRVKPKPDHSRNDTTKPHAGPAARGLALPVRHPSRAPVWASARRAHARFKGAVWPFPCRDIRRI